MQYRALGATGITVSSLALGAMNFGAFGNTDQDDATRIVHAALDGGVNLVDTADVYSVGESEEIIGNALAGRRDSVVLATKAGNPMSDDPNETGASRRWLTRSVESSLRRLKTDHIDLFQVHRPDWETSDEETLGALTDLQRAGKILHFGSSTFPAHRIVKGRWIAGERALSPYVTEQPSYSILMRGIESDVLPVAREYGMGVIAWSPLGAGWLTGAISRDGEGASEHVRSGQTGQPSEVRRGRQTDRHRQGRRPVAHPARPRLRHRAHGRNVSHCGTAHA
jgi:aryl-alcohol dehydrogenase-like predicted oxidoreductase